MEYNNIAVIEDDIIIEIMKDHPDLYDWLNYNEYNIKDRLENNSFYYEQYRILWLQERNKLKRIQLLKDEYIGNLYQDLKNGDRKLSKVEIEKYFIPSDDKAIKFEKLYMRQKIRCEVFEYIADAFKQQNYAMGNYIKNMQL
jgi:hypothetical protein